MPVIPAFGGLRQEDLTFEASLGAHNEFKFKVGFGEEASQLEPDRAARGRDAGQDSSHHQSLFDFITQAVMCEDGLQPLQWQCVSACRQGGQLQLHPTVTQLQLIACSRRSREWVLWGWDTEAVRSLESVATLRVSCLILATALVVSSYLFLPSRQDFSV